MTSTAESPVRFRDCYTNAIRLHVATAGEGPLVVLLHGFPDTWRCWERQIPALAQHFRVAAPDLRGFGASDRPRDGYELASLADDVAGLIHNLGRGAPAALVGHDWGGSLAWAVAHRHPDKVTRLTVINAPHPHQFGKALRTVRQARKSWYMFAFQLPWIPEFALRRGNGALLRRGIRAAAARPDAVTDADLDAALGPLLQPRGLETALQWYRSALRGGPGAMRAMAAAIQAPVQVIWGEEDPVLGADLLEGLDRYAPQLRIERLPHVGHWVTREAAADVSRLLLDWLLPDAHAPAQATA